MNQSIEAVKARDRNNPFTTLYFSDLEMYRRATRHAPPWPYDSYEELDEAMRLAAEPMHPPTAAEIDRMARMAAAQWATTSSPVYVADAARIAGTPIYVTGTAAATTSTT